MSKHSKSVRERLSALAAEVDRVDRKAVRCVDCGGIVENPLPGLPANLLLCQPCARRKAAAVLGVVGGKAGTGEAKRRGDSAYYKALRAKVKTYRATLKGKTVRVTIPED